MIHRNVPARSAALVCAVGLVFLSAAGPARAHAVHYRVLERDGAAVVFEVGFGPKEPASYAAVLVYGPEDREVEHQNGRTDRAGRFAFLPDRPGAWLVTVDAGMGHQVSFEVDVGQPAEGVQQDQAVQGNSLSRREIWIRAGLGVSLLVNLGFLSVLLRRRFRRA